MRLHSWLVVLMVLLLLPGIAGCGESSPSASESGQPVTGINGTVKYTGASKGGILIYVTDQLPGQNQPPQPLQMSQFDDVTGDYTWKLSPGKYYVNAFFAIDRPVQGPPAASEPAVNCDPIDVKADESVKIEVVMSDADAGGKSRSCLKKS